MNTKSLVDAAVFNSTTAGRKGFADRLFAHWFSRLVYAQIWEDPRVDLEALQLAPGANILTISSGGCNALAYLSAQPKAVHAVDLNGAHLAMLEIKKQAIKHLPDYDAVLQFLGDANQADNLKRYQRHIRPHLDDNASDFWESRGINGKPRYHYFSKNAYQYGLLGRFIGFAHHLVKLLGGDLQKIADAKNQNEQKLLFDTYVAPIFDHPFVRFLANRPIALYSLGIPPSQFAALKRDVETGKFAGMHLLFKERMRHLACDFPLEENCFAQQAFARRYNIHQQTALPMYLQQQYFQTIKQHIERVQTHHTSLTAFLNTQAAASMDAYLFLDAQDWMDKTQLTELWREVTRTAAPGAKVVFRTGGSASPLEQQLPAELLTAWHTDQTNNRQLYARDRSAIYGGMHVYQKV